MECLVTIYLVLNSEYDSAFCTHRPSLPLIGYSLKETNEKYLEVEKVVTRFS